jgi:hypothetical protein
MIVDAIFPSEFLGRCATCLDNAHLDSKPCTIGYGQGRPLNDDECLIRRCQKAYLREREALSR